MSIQNMPTALQPIIQQGFLEREFHDALQSAIGYRAVADREPVAINVGETVTKTRNGLKAPVTTPLTPSTNTNMDNGITPSSFTVEQYTLSINQYGDSIDLNTVTSQVGIANQFLKNAQVNGVQARQSLDRIARNALFGAYLGGNSRVRTTLGAPATTLAVDDVRGFAYALSNGQMLPVSAGNPLPVLVGGNVYNCIGVAVDGSNVSTTIITGGGISGISGTLTFSTNVTVADGTAGNVVASTYAAPIIRPNGKYIGGSATQATATQAALTSADKLTLGAVEDAVAMLRNNTGMDSVAFNLYLDNMSMRQLWADNDFKLMYQGQYGSQEMRVGKVFQLLGCNFIPTTEAPYQPANTGVTAGVRRPILCAPGALVEGDFAGMEQRAIDASGVNSIVQTIDDVVQVVRAPIDRLQQIIAQSWFWIGGFTAPTDATATQNIIPTASQTYYKRAVVIEHAA
ncbi:MAG: hypothetical protein JHC40_20860 [Burkholderiales bacterium]|nr:hypothetical protein [Burkholderiales bacterium]